MLMSTTEKSIEENISEADTTQDESSFRSCATDSETSLRTNSDMDNLMYTNNSNDDYSSDSNSQFDSDFNRNDEKKDWTEGEQFKQAQMFQMQSSMAAQEAFFRSGYDGQAAAAYYGWLPGIAPMRFPAFFYPSQFIGFPPNVALAGSNMTQEDAQKYYGLNMYNKQNKKQTNDNNIKNCDSPTQDNVANLTTQNISSLAKPQDIVSDTDEGLVLDGNDSETSDTSVIRHAQDKTSGGLRRVANVSVIQENCSIKRSNTQITHRFEQPEETAKRGRASTRQIEKTDQYWDRRKKNNVSAKKSRDARRQREVITNQRSAMLEGENLRLRAEVAGLREENERLKKQLSSLKSI